MLATAKSPLDQTIHPDQSRPNIAEHSFKTFSKFTARLLIISRIVSGRLDPGSEVDHAAVFGDPAHIAIATCYLGNRFTTALL